MLSVSRRIYLAGSIWRPNKFAGVFTQPEAAPLSTPSINRSKDPILDGSFKPIARFAQSRTLSYKASNDVPHDGKAADALTECDYDDEYERNWESEVRYNQPHPIWKDHEVRSVEKTHFKPREVSDWVALGMIKVLRNAFDIFSGYKFWLLTPAGWMNRIVVLETVAGVPGLVGAGYRHLRSLRQMKRDYGWIHTLLEEAENERMHLMTALMIKSPGYIFRTFVVAGQIFFFPLFSSMYAISPKTAHRFVGYLEEEAVRTYTHLLADLESGRLPELRDMPAPKLAKAYWQLKDDATFLDMIYAIRADESHHRDVNHTFADMGPNEENPYKPGQ